MLRRKDRELFSQWQEHHDLPPREARVELPKKKGDLYQQWIGEGSLTPEDIEGPVVRPATQKATVAAPFLSGRLTLLLIISGALNVILLIAVAVLATILALK